MHTEYQINIISKKKGEEKSISEHDIQEKI